MSSRPYRVRNLRAVVTGLALILSLWGCSRGSVTAPWQEEKQSGMNCQPLTKAGVIDLLVALSSARPAGRVELTQGEARELFREEADLISEGWPADPMGWWRQGAWLGLQLQPTGTETVALLRHGDLYSRTVTRFRFTCSGDWRLTGIGDESVWYSPFPASVPGQDGPLTEELGLILVQQMFDHYGTPAMRATAAGAELERGRLVAITSRGGRGLREIEWPGLGSRLALSAKEPGRVVGRWLSQDGRETGEQVLFERLQGMWRVTDHTHGGYWASSPGNPEYGKMNLNLDLLGFELGKNATQLAPVIPSGDETGDPPLLFRARQLFISYDKRGEVQAIEARSGATRRGVNVGDPADQVLRLYGEPQERETGAFVYRAGPLRLRFLLEPQTGSKRWVAGIVLEETS